MHLFQIVTTTKRLRIQLHIVVLKRNFFETQAIQKRISLDFLHGFGQRNANDSLLVEKTTLGNGNDSIGQKHGFEVDIERFEHAAVLDGYQMIDAFRQRTYNLRKIRV